MVDNRNTETGRRKQGSSPLDSPIPVTFFVSEKARTKTEESLSLRELARRIRETRKPSKSKLPWLKLARYGNRKSEKNSLRHDANVIAATGLELDNDGGPWPIEEAERFFKQHGIAALLFESPSAAAEPNRWRGLLPFSREMGRNERSALVERLGALIPGLDLKASRGFSTAFYFGAEGEWTPRTILVDGKHVERVKLPEPEEGAEREKDDSDSGDLFRLARECVFDMDRDEFSARAWEDDASAAHLDRQKDSDRAINRAWAKALIMKLAREMKVTAKTDSQFLGKARAHPEIKGVLPSHEIKAYCKREWEAAPESAFDDDDSNSVDESDFITAEALAALPRPFDFLEGLLYEGQTSIVYGAPKAGKSFLMLDVACAVGLGRKWAGRECDARKVLVIPLEGRGTIIDRVRAWEMKHKEKCPLIFRLKPLDLINDRKAVRAIIRYVKKHKIGLVIIDTLSRAIPSAEENSATDMGKAVQVADAIARTGSHVMFVHHSNRQGTMRGSNVLIGAPDLVLKITRCGDQREVMIEENRHGRDGERMHFTLEPCVLDMKDARDKPIKSATVKLSGEWFEDETQKGDDGKLTESEEAALRILRARPQSAALLGPLGKDEARDLLKRKGWTHKPDADAEALKKARQRVLASLERKGAIEIDSNDELAIAS